VRLFFAINFAPELRERLWSDAQALRSAVSRGVKWTEPAAMHVTVKFLGETDEASVASLVDAARTAVASYSPVDAAIRRFGAFPNFDRPRIVWVGIDDRGQLGRVATAIDRACTTFGFEPERRPFAAHITLGRVKDVLSRDELTELRQAAERSHTSRSARIETVDLMRSHLGPAGQRYDLMEAIPLGSGRVQGAS
jgi:RNA 2',3'-cyclic 3'-phosphodiesterase